MSGSPAPAENCPKLLGPGPPSYRTRDQARASLFDYVEVFYNRQRRHSTINYEAPLVFEAAHAAS